MVPFGQALDLSSRIEAFVNTERHPATIGSLNII